MENKCIYKTLYPWQVAEKVKEGKIVKMLDRKDDTVCTVNGMNAAAFLAVTTEKDETNRYTFWYNDQSAIMRGAKNE